MLQIHKTVTTCYIKIARVIGVFSIPILGSKTKQLSKITPQICKINEKPPNYPKINMNFQKPTTHYQNQPKINTKS